ncbi:MAG: hypothetical protein IKJ62_05045 [Alphaproteobacteria bacterium]|nr:hypothetical protein [Alphaproteobacteria bacterium]
MKTKIIYISGGETFEMTQIRAALDEVRTVLGLDKNTILFGVPVDDDSAINTETLNAKTESLTESDAEPLINQEQSLNTYIDADGTLANDDFVQIDQADPSVQPDAEISADDVTTEIDNETSEKIIPILSILSAQEEITDPAEQDEEIVTELADNTNQAVDAEQDKATVVEEIAEESIDLNEAEQAVVVNITETVQEYDSDPTNPGDTTQIFDISVDTELTTPIADDEMPVTPQTVTIGDMISDDVPEMPAEKTLEQLLESMKPLREDLHNEQDEIAPVVPDEEVSTLGTDTDATLAQLATEFAKNQDKIAKNSKSGTTGKIGKLKNILPLPFSKQKNKDSGLMGDLFGWAGIAANDDEITLPGFFTTNMSANKVHNDQE